MKKNVGNIITSVFFLMTILYFGSETLYASKSIIIDKLKNTSSQTLKSDLVSIEEQYKDKFYKKNEFIDIYGLGQMVLNKKMIGNMEFIKDNNDVIQAFDFAGPYTHFASEMLKLEEATSKKKIPLLYVQIPSRVIKDFTEIPQGYVNTENDNMDTLINELVQNDIDVLDYREYVEEKQYKPEDVFFKTDIHLTTETEWDILKKLITKLELDYGLIFENKNKILDLDNYIIDRRKFIGNYARSSGKFFSGIDEFNMYIPKFETNNVLLDADHNVVSEGAFDDVLLNGYQKQQNTDERTYWVTNYGQFTSPSYQYVNNIIESGNKILLIMDSMGYRMASYLSLMSQNITIIDPRFDENGYYLNKELNENNFDAVVVLQGYTLKDTIMIPDDLDKSDSDSLQAQIISHSAPKTVNADETHNIDITVKNTGDEKWSEKSNIRLGIWQDGVDHGYRIYIPEGTEISPGEEYTFTLSGFVAPPRDSTYLEFQMLQEGITYFGEKERVDIQVND